MTEPATWSRGRAYLAMTDAVGRHWLDVFAGNTRFYSAVYWDLLTALWRRDGPVRKTDALRFMTAVKSAHTAGKYIDEALAEGFLVETANPDDARSKLVALTPAMRARLDAFFEAAVAEMRAAARRVGDDGGRD